MYVPTNLTIKFVDPSFFTNLSRSVKIKKIPKKRLQINRSYLSNKNP